MNNFFTCITSLKWKSTFLFVCSECDVRFWLLQLANSYTYSLWYDLVKSMIKIRVLTTLVTILQCIDHENVRSRAKQWVLLTRKRTFVSATDYLLNLLFVKANRQLTADYAAHVWLFRHVTFLETIANTTSKSICNTANHLFVRQSHMEHNLKYVGFNKYVICNSRILNTQTKSNIHNQRKNVQSDVFFKTINHVISDLHAIVSCWNIIVKKQNDKIVDALAK